MIYESLPGFRVETADGNLRSRRTPNSESVIVIGTAGAGPADAVFQVTDRPTAGAAFGFDGTLIRGMEEVSTYSDNVFLYRMGTKPASVTGLGKDTGAGPVAGFDVVFNGERSVDTGKNYRVYCQDGVLYVFHNEVLVYANDTGVQVVDTLDVTVTGAGEVAKGLDVGTAKTWAGSIALDDLDALVGGANTPEPVYVAAVTGVGMTVREVYVALSKALEALDIFHVQHVYCPNAMLDAKTVALGGTPATDVDCLDWLKTSVDTNGTTVYHWASEANDSEGTVVAAHGVWTDASDRIGAGYREVNFGYLLASFAAVQSDVNANQGGCIAYIGCLGPKSFNTDAIRTWIGKSPTVDPTTGVVTAAGRGLLGIPCIVGTSSAALNLLCVDKAAGRTGGFFANDANAYDGGASYDRNHRPIDIGAYLHVAADWANLQNGYGSYTGNIAGMVCGFVSNLDHKSSPTNKELVGCVQKHRPNNAQLNQFTKIGINMLRFFAIGEAPKLCHGMLVARSVSDFDRLVRQRVKFMCVKLAATTADPFIGESTTDGLTMQALRTALDAKFVEAAKRGYWQRVQFSITATPAEQKLGHASIELVIVNPAEELVQLRATVGLSR